MLFSRARQGHAVAVLHQQPPSTASPAELQRRQAGHPTPDGANMHTAAAAAGFPLDQVDQHIPSVDGAGMYGAFEDAAWSPSAGDARKTGDAVFVAAPACTGSAGISSFAPACLSPFAAAADSSSSSSSSSRVRGTGLQYRRLSRQDNLPMTPEMPRTIGHRSQTARQTTVPLNAIAMRCQRVSSSHKSRQQQMHP